MLYIDEQSSSTVCFTNIFERTNEAHGKNMKGCLSFVILLIIICAIAAMAKVIAWTIMIIIGAICLLIVVAVIKFLIKILF